MSDPNRPSSDQPDEALEVAGGATSDLDAWFSDQVTSFL